MRSKSYDLSMKKKQEELLSQKSYMECIISLIPDALIVVNPDSTFRSVNKATLNLLDYKEHELISQPVKKIFIKEEERILHKCFQKIMEHGSAYNINLTFLTKEGKKIPMNFSGTAMREGEKIINIVGIARDMSQVIINIGDLEKQDRDLKKRSEDSTRTQRAMLHIMGDLKDANDELEMANKKLHKFDQLKSDFVSMVSHELRTPLTVTREAISQVLDGICGETNKKQKQFLSMSIEEIDRLARLIENLLDISKIEAHKVELKRELIDIISLAKDVNSNFDLTLQNKGLELKYNFPKDNIELYMDKDKIAQVLVNLISNAIKFTPAGYIEISVIDKENVVECTISDTGIGISEKELLKVFNKFTQFGQEFESTKKGTGLGLVISKGIIELHSGKIWVESKLGQGTKISFTLPKYSPRKLFKEYVTDGLAEAIKEGLSLSIIIFKVKNYDALQEKLGQDKIASIMHGLEQLVKTNLRCEADISIEDTQSILVVLPEIDKKGSELAVERFKSNLDDYLSREGLAKEIEVDLRAASFPEDAKTKEKLLNIVQL
jgi:PAS domain S-box-containing protein